MLLRYIQSPGGVRRIVVARRRGGWRRNACAGLPSGGPGRVRLCDHGRMNSPFDSLSAAEDLEAAGFERDQAKALARSMRDAVNAGQDSLATKQDVLKIAISIVIANATLTFGIVKFLA